MQTLDGFEPVLPTFQLALLLNELKLQSHNFIFYAYEQAGSVHG